MNATATTTAALHVLDDARAPRTLPRLDQLAQACDRADAAMLMTWENTLGEQHAFTAAELARWSDKTANFLAARGVGAGDAVALSLRQNYQLWFALLALDKLGARAVLLPEDADEAEVARLLGESGAKAVVCTNQGRAAEVLEHVVYACPTVEVRALVNGDGAPALFALPDEADESLVPPSCGEDGLPHGAQLSGPAGVCALGCVRRGWLDFNTCVRLAPALPPARSTDAESGASLAVGELVA